MSLTFLIILSIIQGVTEFLPISSSAHLILIPFFNENPYQGRSFDVCLHFGCLLAVLYYLKKDLIFYMKIYFYNEKDFSYKKINLFLNNIKQQKDIQNVSRYQKFFLDTDFH